MKLLKCHIENFGKLSNYDYDFQDGLNTIKEENGFGKTTFASFIKAMFYGLESKRNTKVLIDRKKYEPWQGGKFGGNIEFELQGKKYKIERFFEKKEVDDTFKVYDLSTNLETDDFSQNIGEEIFKLNKEAYERSTFISGQSMETSMNDSLNAKLGNILENENDINSSEKAINALDEAIKRYKKTGGRGEINEAILEKTKLEKKLENSKIDEKTLEERKNSLENIKKQIAEKMVLQENLRKELTSINEEESKKAKLEHYNLLKNQLEESKKNIIEFSSKANVDSDLNEKIEYNKNKLENINNKIEVIANKLGQNKKIGLSSLAIATIIAIISLILYIKKLTTVGICLSVVCLIFAFVFVAYSVLIAKTRGKLERKKIEKENLEDTSKTLNSIYEKQQIEREADLNRLNSDYELKQKNMQVFEQQNNVEELNSYTPKATDVSKNEVEKKLNTINAEINKLNDEKNYIQNQIEVLEASIDTFETENEIDEITENIEKMKQNLSILEKTKKYLSTAKEQFSSHYLKGMQDSFIQNLEILNGSKMEVNLDVNLNAEVNENGSNKKLDFMSTGYKDLIYICMRLSLIESLFEGEKPFIILDDPFVNLDEEKIENAMKLIGTKAEEYQIIYFVCHESRI